MNPEELNETTYLVGEYTDGKFWDSTETSDLNDAKKAFDHYRTNHPAQHIVLIQKTSNHSILVNHHPIRRLGKQFKLED